MSKAYLRPLDLWLGPGAGAGLGESQEARSGPSRGHPGAVRALSTALVLPCTHAASLQSISDRRGEVSEERRFEHWAALWGQRLWSLTPSFGKQYEVVDSPQRSKRCQHTSVYEYSNHVPLRGKLSASEPFTGHFKHTPALLAGVGQLASPGSGHIQSQQP